MTQNIAILSEPHVLTAEGGPGCKESIRANEPAHRNSRLCEGQPSSLFVGVDSVCLLGLKCEEEGK